MPFATKTSCFARFFRENKKLNLELESVVSKIASLRSMHNDMSARPCDNCNMIIVNLQICGSCTLMLHGNLRVPN
jgi:hypothetical protein